jgi:hypothetical protein
MNRTVAELEAFLKQADYYHGAPTTERARIQQHGLQPSNPQLNGRWILEDAGFDQEFARMQNQHRSTDPGVYMTMDPDNAYRGDPGKNDVWRIDENQVDPTQWKTDPYWARISPTAIPPQALSLHTPAEEAMWAQRTADYYHVAPTVDRERIRQHGLQPANPMANPEWGSADDWKRRHGDDPQISTGVYGWPQPGQAYNYAEGLESARDTPMDIWKIPESPYQWQVDPDLQRYMPTNTPQYTTQPVMDAELHEGPEHRVWDVTHSTPYEQMWNNYKPLGINAEKPGYDEYWDKHMRTPEEQVWSHRTRHADNYTLDSREWPDPSEPRAAKPPAPKGCTCKQGLKLECPVHGMHATQQDYDNTWAQPQAQPIGYPQDQPRNWQQAQSKVVQAVTVKEWDRGSQEAYPGRRPVIYDPTSDVLHVGPDGSSHWDVQNNMNMDYWSDGADHAHGWIGPNPEGYDNIVQNAGQPNEIGWYRHRQAPETVQPYMQQLADKMTPAPPQAPKPYGHGQNVLDILNRAGSVRRSHVPLVVAHRGSQLVESMRRGKDVMSRLSLFVPLKHVGPFNENIHQSVKLLHTIAKNQSSRFVHSTFPLQWEITEIIRDRAPEEDAVEATKQLVVDDKTSAHQTNGVFGRPFDSTQRREHYVQTNPNPSQRISDGKQMVTNPLHSSTIAETDYTYAERTARAIINTARAVTSMWR